VVIQARPKEEQAPRPACAPLLDTCWACAQTIRESASTPDDCTRLAYAEVIEDETATTAIAFFRAPRHTRPRVADRQRLALPFSGARNRLSHPRDPPPTHQAPQPQTNGRACDSSALCSEAGPTERSTPLALSAQLPLMDSYGPTTTDDTKPSGDKHPSPA
jgi:hypothetical protein